MPFREAFCIPCDPGPQKCLVVIGRLRDGLCADEDSSELRLGLVFDMRVGADRDVFSIRKSCSLATFVTSYFHLQPVTSSLVLRSPPLQRQCVILRCLSLSIHIPLPDALTRPWPPLDIHMLHLDRCPLQRLVPITQHLCLPIRTFCILQPPICAPPSNICHRIPVPFTIMISNTRWRHAPASERLEHGRPAVKVLHASCVFARQAVVAAHHGEGHHRRGEGEKDGAM
jgi:hypothetical protein